ncbi:MAG: hypothetical protein WA666_02665 [Nitrospirota bacterium]
MKKNNVSISGIIIASILLVTFSAMANAQPGDTVGGKKYEIKGKVEMDKHAIDKLMDDSEEDGEVEMSPDGKSIVDLEGKFKISQDKSFEEACLDFIDRHKDAFGLKAPREELKTSNELIFYNQKDGSNHILFNQYYHGLRIMKNTYPIMQANFYIHRNKDGYIYAIDCRQETTPEISIKPIITITEAEEIARKYSKLKNLRLYPCIYGSRLAYAVGPGYIAFFMDANTGGKLSIPEINGE